MSAPQKPAGLLQKEPTDCKPQKAGRMRGCVNVHDCRCNRVSDGQKQRLGHAHYHLGFFVFFFFRILSCAVPAPVLYYSKLTSNKHGISRRRDYRLWQAQPLSGGSNLGATMALSRPVHPNLAPMKRIFRLHGQRRRDWGNNFNFPWKLPGQIRIPALCPRPLHRAKSILHRAVNNGTAPDNSWSGGKEEEEGGDLSAQPGRASQLR